jgi:3',5'-cyclic AMP phosphodiesterase CpdA
MKNLKFIYLFLLVLLAASCAKDELLDPTVQPTDSGALKSASKLKIAVISDIHYMSPALLPANPETDYYFQMYLAQDPKLIHLSDLILRQAITELKMIKPDILLIPGDMTKDGELANHQIVAGLLNELAVMDVKIFVVPGNHDINNSDALDFSTSPPSLATHTSVDDFTSVYGDFGYDDAIYKDENSLSYICAVNKKLWILGIDACRYEDNEPGESPITGGRIKEETMTWIEDKMNEARENRIEVLALMHHGTLQHYYQQEATDPGYLVADWPERAGRLMNAGVKLVFTGHYHANDISQLAAGKNTFSDIETGSLVTAPIPYRIMTLDDNFIKIESRRITNIDYPFPAGLNFVSYSKVFLSAHLDGYFDYILKNMYGIPEEQAVVVAPFLRNGVMAHYAGDEKIKPDERKKLNQLAMVVPPESSFLIDVINSFWTDLPIADTQVHIKLK